VKRLAIRILVAFMVCVAFAAFAATPIPKDQNNNPALPAVALQQVELYRLEVALAVFYGGLLLVTPAFSGLVGGRLPIEISARGARFADEAEYSAELSDTAIKELRQATNDLKAGLAAANMKIALLKNSAADNPQRNVGSRR
jgi:hypothetical protein